MGFFFEGIELSVDSHGFIYPAKLGLLNDWKEVVYARSESVGVRAPRGQCNYARDYVRDSVGRDLFLTLPWQLTRRIFLVSRKTLDIFIFLFHKWNLSLLLLFSFRLETEIFSRNSKRKI